MPVIDNRTPMTLSDDLMEDQPVVIRQNKVSTSGHHRKETCFQPRKESKTSWQVKPARSMLKHVLVN